MLCNIRFQLENYVFIRARNFFDGGNRGRWPNKEPSRAVNKTAAEQLGISENLLESYMDMTLTSEPVDDGWGLLLELLGLED